MLCQIIIPIILSLIIAEEAAAPIEFSPKTMVAAAELLQKHRNEFMMKKDYWKHIHAQIWREKRGEKGKGKEKVHGLMEKLRNLIEKEVTKEDKSEISIKSRVAAIYTFVGLRLDQILLANGKFDEEERKKCKEIMDDFERFVKELEIGHEWVKIRNLANEASLWKYVGDGEGR